LRDKFQATDPSVRERWESNYCFVEGEVASLRERWEASSRIQREISLFEMNPIDHKKKVN